MGHPVFNLATLPFPDLPGFEESYLALHKCQLSSSPSLCLSKANLSFCSHRQQFSLCFLGWHFWTLCFHFLEAEVWNVSIVFNMAPSSFINGTHFYPYNNSVGWVCHYSHCIYEKEILNNLGRFKSGYFCRKIQVFAPRLRHGTHGESLLIVSPNLLLHPELTWNLPISALNLISVEFITCRGVPRKICYSHPSFPPSPWEGL